MEMGERDSGVALAELVAAFSLATDLGLGQPMEHVLRSWVIAARLGDHVGLEPDDRGALFYVATLAWVGCVADTPELASWFGDDIAFRGDSRQIDLAGREPPRPRRRLPRRGGTPRRCQRDGTGASATRSPRRRARREPPCRPSG